VPDEDSSLASSTDDGLLIRGDGHFGNDTGVSNTLVVVNSFIVVPYLDHLVLASRDEVLTFLGDSQGIDFTSLRAIESSDVLSIEAVPVSDLPVGASGENLGLVGVIEHLLEHCRFEETDKSGVSLEIPNNGRAIV